MQLPKPSGFHLSPWVLQLRPNTEGLVPRVQDEGPGNSSVTTSVDQRAAFRPVRPSPLVLAAPAAAYLAGRLAF